MGIDNGFDSTPHSTFKDLGFNLTKHNTFDVYACGGIGPNPRIGIPVAHDVAPEDVLYHVKAMLMVLLTMVTSKTAVRLVPVICLLKWVGRKLSSRSMKKL